MSILVQSDGHLHILMLYEQIRPRIQNGSLEFTLCYDIILRSYSNKPLEHLFILSPHGLSHSDNKGQRVFNLLDHADTGYFDWVFTEKRAARGLEGIYTLCCPPATQGQQSLTFEATRLKPVCESPPWLSQPDNLEAAGAFISTGMTFAQVKFEDGQKIEPYDQSSSQNTTYWLRLCFRPKATYDVQPARKFGPKDGPFALVQACSSLGLQAILNALDDLLECLAQDRNFKEGALWVRERVLNNTVHKPETSASAEDYRITLISDKQFLVLNPHYDGACGFAGVDPVPREEGTVARTWVTGANQYWQIDPLTTAIQVYLYLKQWAYNKTDAKTKEQISVAVLPDEHDNISHVVEALKRVGYLQEPKPGFYSIDTDGKGSDFFILDRSKASEKNRRERYMFILNALYGNLPIPSSQTEFSRFKPKGCRIQFEIVFFPG